MGTTVFAVLQEEKIPTYDEVSCLYTWSEITSTGESSSFIFPSMVPDPSSFFDTPKTSFPCLKVTIL